VLDHLGDLMLGAEKRAGEIDGDGIVPAGFGNTGRRATLAQGAGVVESDVQPAECLGGQQKDGPEAAAVVIGAEGVKPPM